MAFDKGHFDFIAMGLHGDIGDYSVYTDQRGRKVTYPKDVPKRPPTDAQVRQRTRFKDAMAEWKSLDPETKELLENICRRASLIMTGSGLWISIAMRNAMAEVDTINEQLNVNMPYPTPV